MRSAKCSAVGTVNLQNKTLPQRERNEKICEHRSGVVDIPLVVEPIVVPVPPVLVPVQIPHVQVAVRVAVMYQMPSKPPSFEYSQD